MLLSRCLAHPPWRALDAAGRSPGASRRGQRTGGGPEIHCQGPRPPETPSAHVHMPRERECRGDVHGRDAQVAAARDSSPHAAEGVGGGDGRLALAPRSLAENCVRRDSPSLRPSDQSTCFPGRGARRGPGIRGQRRAELEGPTRFHCIVTGRNS